MTKILVIDDEPGIRYYLSSLLTKLGYEVETVNDSLTGLARAVEPAINLIISDLNMPGEPSNLDLIRKLRELRPDCPVVVISGYPTPERLRVCEELGVVEFLTKPFEISFITSVLKRLVPTVSSAQDAHSK